jgi:hypothetical protein
MGCRVQAVDPLADLVDDVDLPLVCLHDHEYSVR